MERASLEGGEGVEGGPGEVKGNWEAKVGEVDAHCEGLEEECVGLG